ncbi:NAD(P)-dependent dehydrogenase, short-chain alcohol dehydrogenase family [Thalassovita litoralis]|uniref:NAD(P)-dependent dehydrogenase, short-chain alcohol dehydrogenase family n=1 Tax=Thalassovita litoralis TaxID=1010611 RepID=A0A521FN24_9RHOB|nr:NAD(P)-dependent dehydrogenase, short-chain alcohol dehydrogenase family [Thalassovita litoralis]
MVSQFAGKTVFVSGGTSGINLGIAQHFAREGANVFVISRDSAKVEAAVAGLRALGAQADGLSADVRQFDQVKGALDQCAQTFGPIDILVSGAAGNFLAKAENISSNGFRAVMEIDVLGTHHVMSAAFPHLRKPGACILNISAPQGSVAMVGQAHVCAAKSGIDMLTRALALEWGPYGIRVNSVSPGPIADTEGQKRLVPNPAAVQERIDAIPLRRMGSLTDVSDLCLFLASDKAAYITGTVIPVDGGTTLNPTPTRMGQFLED